MKIGICMLLPEGSLLLLLPLQGKQEKKNGSDRTTLDNSNRPKDSNKKTIIYFFWGKGCPHCEEEKQFLAGLKREHPSLEIREYEVWYNKENAGLMAAMLRAHDVRSSGVPVTFVRDQVFPGFTEHSRASIEKAIKECSLVPCGDPGEGLVKTDHSERAARTLPFVSEKAKSIGINGNRCLF